MGTVYEAEHLLIGRRVALKVLHPAHAQRRDAVWRFRHEARVAGSIGHPNICEIYDVGQLEDGSPYLVMERLHGETLADRIERENELPFLDVIDITLQVLSALSTAHEKSIIHRDIKPENIFLSERAGFAPIAKLLDFGISKAAADEDLHLTRTGMVMGTPYYMAPEQARGEVIDPRIDLYATGVILYESLTGQRPFAAPNYSALLRLILFEDPKPMRELRPSLPEGFEIVVKKALAKDRELRFQSAQEFIAALAALRAEVVAYRPTPNDLDRLVRQYRQNEQPSVLPPPSVRPSPRLQTPPPEAPRSVPPLFSNEPTRHGLGPLPAGGLPRGFGAPSRSGGASAPPPLPTPSVRQPAASSPPPALRQPAASSPPPALRQPAASSPPPALRQPAASSPPPANWQQGISAPPPAARQQTVSAPPPGRQPTIAPPTNRGPATSPPPPVVIESDSTLASTPLNVAEAEAIVRHAAERAKASRPGGPLASGPGAQHVLPPPPRPPPSPAAPLSPPHRGASAPGALPSRPPAGLPGPSAPSLGRPNAGPVASPPASPYRPKHPSLPPLPAPPQAQGRPRSEMPRAPEGQGGPLPSPAAPGTTPLPPPGAYRGLPPPPGPRRVPANAPSGPSDQRPISRPSEAPRPLPVDDDEENLPTRLYRPKPGDLPLPPRFKPPKKDP